MTSPAEGPGLNARQSRFVSRIAKRQAFKRVAALRKIAEHVGLISRHKALQPSESVLAERLDHYGADFLEAALAVVADGSVAPYRRAAAAVIVECFIPDWREKADPRLVGMVVERDDKEVRAWRRAVLDRDGNQCTKCGSREMLEAHHIVRWADCPAARVVIDNGVTLCKACHMEEHGAEQA